MKTLDEIITERKSVRTFDASRPLTPEDVVALQTALGEAKSPFGGDVAIDLKQFDLKGSFKPSTYGTISGAEWYFLMGTDSTQAAQLTLGFRMEQVVLKAAEMGLGTCWIAATFKGTQFAQAIDFPSNIPLQVVMPVGYPAEKRGMLDRITRTVVGSAKRRPMDELFLSHAFTKPVSTQSRYYHALEMMRLAPSSTNSQPWRALVDGDTVYFYYENKSKASVLDLGIGLAHFWLAVRQRGIHGYLEMSTNAPAHDDWIPLVQFHTSPQ